MGPDDALAADLTIHALLDTQTPCAARGSLERRQADVLKVAAGLRRCDLPPSTARWQRTCIRAGCCAMAMRATTSRSTGQPWRASAAYISSARRALRESPQAPRLDRARQYRDRKSAIRSSASAPGLAWGDPDGARAAGGKADAKRRTRGRVVPPSVRADLVCTACGVVGHVASIHAKDRGSLMHPHASNAIVVISMITRQALAASPIMAISLITTIGIRCIRMHQNPRHLYR